MKKFVLRLVLYEVTDPDTDGEEWSVEDVRDIDEFDSYADGHTCLHTLEGTIPGLRASWGRPDRKAIRREVGKRLRNEGFRIVESYCDLRAEGRRYKIRVMKPDMTGKVLWGDRPCVKMSNEDVLQAQTAITETVPVRVWFHQGNPRSLTAIWEM